MHRPIEALREMIAQDGVIQAAGAGDAGQALVVQDVGFPAVYVSGAWVNHTHGFSDGTVTLVEMAARIREISGRVSVPVIADADEGFGDRRQLVRTVREYERAGAAALHIEDMAAKKKGRPMEIPEMVERIQIARDARRASEMLIIARTDAAGPWREGFDADREGCEVEAVERGIAYSNAGADLIMPVGISVDWITKYGNDIPTPLLVLANPMLSPHGDQKINRQERPSADELGPLNVKVVIYAAFMLTKIIGLIRDEYREWLDPARRVPVTDRDAANKTYLNEVVRLEGD